MSDLPRGWVWTTLGEVAEYINGRGFKKSEWTDSGRPIIRIQNLTGSGSSFNHFAGELLPKHRVQTGDLLVSWAATLSVHRWSDPREGALNQHIFKVEPRSLIDGRFLEHTLRYALDDMYQASHGSGMVHITRGKFEETPIVLPPLAEQHRIVEVIEDHFSRLDAAESTLRASRNKAEALRLRAIESVLENAVDYVHEEVRARAVGIAESRKSLVAQRRRAATPPAYQLDLPPGWTTASVDALCWQIQYGTSTKTGEARAVSDVPVIRMGNIHDGQIQVDDLKYLPADDPSLVGLILEPGDLLFNRTNSAELVGKTAVFTDQLPVATFASYLIRCRPVHGVSGEWISLVANSSIGRRYIKSVMSQQVGQANVNGTKLAAMPIPITSADAEDVLLEQISEVRRSGQRLVDEIDSAIRRSSALRRSLLRAAFDGELVDQDRNDEPADLALARLRSAAKPASKRLGKRSTAGLSET